MSVHDEGYVKFTNAHQFAAIPVEVPEVLINMRNMLHRGSLIGMYADGIGYGNISMRVDAHRFLISGTQTGAMFPANAEHFCLVTDARISENKVSSIGPVAASSESMTHAACYAAASEIQMVIHVHHAGMWQYFLHQAPTIAEDIPYGTPAMAEALFAHVCALGSTGCAYTAGHTDGIFFFATTPENAMQLTEAHYAIWSANKG